jgi:hypothetical protein
MNQFYETHDKTEADGGSNTTPRPTHQTENKAGSSMDITNAELTT